MTSATATDLHSATTVASITAKPASGGSIAGWRVECPVCGFVFTTSLYTIALADTRDHIAYMMAREAREIASRPRCGDCDAPLGVGNHRDEPCRAGSGSEYLA